MNTKLTFTAVTRDFNSWNPSAGEKHIIWTCGHKHRTLDAATHCLISMGNASSSYHAKIERSDWDGHSEPGSGQRYSLGDAMEKCEIY